MIVLLPLLCMLVSGMKRSILQQKREKNLLTVIIPSTFGKNVLKTIFSRQSRQMDRMKVTRWGHSLARPLIAEEVVKIAQKEGATVVGHGFTGKGNDQLRFDVIIRGAGLEVVAPIRELNLTRDWKIEYARHHNIPVPVKKDKPWSMDENCWSRSIEGGLLEDPAYHPPEEIYLWTVPAYQAPDKPEKLTIAFESGIPVALNGKKLSG